MLIQHQCSSCIFARSWCPQQKSSCDCDVSSLIQLEQWQSISIELHNLMFKLNLRRGNNFRFVITIGICKGSGNCSLIQVSGALSQRIRNFIELQIYMCRDPLQNAVKFIIRRQGYHFPGSLDFCLLVLWRYFISLLSSREKNNGDIPNPQPGDSLNRGYRLLLESNGNRLNKCITQSSFEILCQ